MLDDRVRACSSAWKREDAERARARPAGGRALARRRARRPASSSSRSSRRRWTARCSRSAARAATRRSGSRPASGHLGGRVLSLEHDPRKIEAWRANIAEAGLEEWAELIEGDASETFPAIDDVFDVVFLDAEKEDYEQLFQAARDEARAGRPRRRRQRPLTRGDARRVLAGPPGRPDARVGHRPARPRPRALRDPPATAADTFGANRGKEVVREWRFPVRAVEVPAGRGASPGPTGNRLASVGDDALRAARPLTLGPRQEAPLLIHRW